VETVKVNINFREGIFQLEGPRDFVEKYLDLYLPAATILLRKVKPTDSVILSEGEKAKVESKLEAKVERAVE